MTPVVRPHYNDSRNVKKDDAFFNRVVSDMKDALAEERPIIQIPLTSVTPEPTPGSRSLKFKGPVLVVTDAFCASACLHFMDAIKLIPGVKHVGQTTSADSVFMQTLNEAPLGDSMVNLSFPVLRILNRARGNNVPIVPEIQFKGDISDTLALKKWASELR